MTLSEFLLARIAEDEAVAREHERPDGYTGLTWQFDYHDRMHVLWVDPAHILAECEAKRRIVEACDHAGDAAAEYHERYHSGVEDGLEKAMRHLAAVYSDHPDYRQEWKP